MHPDVLGNLEGIPYDARVRANRTTIERTLAELVADERDLAQQMAGIQARIDELASGFQRADGYAIVELREQLAALSRELAETQEMRAFCSNLLTETTVGYDAEGRRHDITGHQVVVFDPDHGRFAEVVGTIGPNTANIAVLVGGTGSNVTGMDGQFERAKEFVTSPAVRPAGSLAVISYLGVRCRRGCCSRRSTRPTP